MLVMLPEAREGAEVKPRWKISMMNLLLLQLGEGRPLPWRGSCYACVGYSGIHLVAAPLFSGEVGQSYLEVSRVPIS